MKQINLSPPSLPSWCSPGIVSPCNARSVAPPSLRVLGSRSQGSKVTPERDETDQRQRRVSRPRIPGPGSDCVTETDRPLLLITAAAPSCVSQGFLLCEQSGNRNMKVKIKVVGWPLFQKLLNGQFSENWTMSMELQVIKCSIDFDFQNLSCQTNWNEWLLSISIFSSLKGDGNLTNISILGLEY